MRILTGVGVVALIVLCVLRRHDLAAAAVAVPPQALGALAALHLTTLVARSEAWRLSLAAIAGAPPPRAAIHAANAGAFVAGVPCRASRENEGMPGAQVTPSSPHIAGSPNAWLYTCRSCAIVSLPYESTIAMVMPLPSRPWA